MAAATIGGIGLSTVSIQGFKQLPRHAPGTVFSCPPDQHLVVRPSNQFSRQHTIFTFLFTFHSSQSTFSASSDKGKPWPEPPRPLSRSCRMHEPSNLSRVTIAGEAVNAMAACYMDQLARTAKTSHPFHTFTGTASSALAFLADPASYPVAGFRLDY